MKTPAACRGRKRLFLDGISSVLPLVRQKSSSAVIALSDRSGTSYEGDFTLTVCGRIPNTAFTLHSDPGHPESVVRRVTWPGRVG